MTRYVSSDGLMSSSTPEGAALWEKIVAESENALGDWTSRLRAVGVKLAHPDDGWVHRDRKTFSLSWYAQFDDQPEVGDLIAFGRPPHSGYEYSTERESKSNGEIYMGGGYRLAKVTKVTRKSSILGYFQDFEYEDTDLRMPPLKPKPISVTWWRRLFRKQAQA